MAKGYSNGLDLQESPSASSTSLSPLSAGIKLKPRAAVSPRRPLGSEDETESSNTERESDMQEELDWDSEDERILGRPYKGSKRQRDKNRLASKKTKESLFDILNSKPPWEDDTPKTVPAAKKVSESNKAEKLMGGYRSNPEEPSSKALSLQAAPYIVPKKFTPIANLEIISTLNGEHHLNDQNIEARSLDAWVKEAHEAGAGLATPSIPDTTSLLTTTSLDGQSDFFSSKASFGFRSKDFPLPPQYLQDEGAITPSPSQTSYTKTAASSNKLNSYKSSPALGSMNAQAATSMMGAAGSSSLSIPALGTGPPRSPPVRRLEAKDERQVYKRVNNDLIDFLRTAEPPSEGAPPASSASPASLPSGINRNSNTLTNGKARLGSVNFRSFMGRGSKRPSTAPGPTSSGSLSTFAATTRAVGFSGGMDGLPAVDEIGRLSVQQQQSRTVHSSLLHIGRRHSESQEVNISSSSSHHRVESAISNSVPPAASLSQTSIRAEKRILSSPALTIPSTRTTMIIPSAHAASPAGKEVRKVSEQAQAAEQDLTLEQLRLETEGKERSQQEETKRKELALIRDSYATFAEAASQLTPRAFGLSMQEQRDRVTHPLSAVSASLQAPLLTPDHSQDDLYHISNSRHSGENVHSKHILQARATSGVDTPPMTPEEKSHSPQFTPLQSLPEGEEARSVTTSVPSRQSGSPASIISASPSTVMPGMAHKHQRTLSAVRRKPSPKVEVDGGPHATTDQSSRHAIEKISHHSVLYEYSAARSREVSSSSQSSGLDPGHTPTPATMLVDEYRGSARHLDQDRSLANLVQCESVKAAAAGQASVRSLPYTLNSVSSSAPLSEITNAPLTTRLNTLSRSGSTNAPSRPPSTVILPLSPRHVSASMIGNKAYQADIHDVLLSMRNNMVCASSVAECLEIVDAALFEYAYDTKDSYAPSIIEEEAGPDDLQTGGGSKKETPGGPHAEQWQLEVSDRKEEATAAADLSSMKEKIVEIVKLRPRTSRYVNRAYDAIIQYYLTYPSTPCILPKGYYSDEGVKTCQEPGEYDQTSLNAVENHSKENTNTPSLYHSVGESTGSIEPADSPQDMTSSNTPLMSETINDETPCRVKRSLDSKNFSLFNSEEEEEEEVLRKPHEEVVG